jgi:DNA-directed RNA polymerase subunit beta
MLTIKSDDVIGRSKAYESIIKDEAIKGSRIPESFNVLVKELQSLTLAVELEKGPGLEIDAEEMLADVTEDEAIELGESELIIGSEPVDGQAVVDLDGPDEDSFEVLAQVSEELGPDEEELKQVEGEEV